MKKGMLFTICILLAISGFAKVAYPDMGISISLSEEIKVEMELTEGWNMISLPVSLEAVLVEGLFPEAVVVYGYKKDFGYIRIQENEELEGGKGILDIIR